MTKQRLEGKELQLWRDTVVACVGGFCGGTGNALSGVLLANGLGNKRSVPENIVAAAFAMADLTVAEFRRRQA